MSMVKSFLKQQAGGIETQNMLIECKKFIEALNLLNITKWCIYKNDWWKTYKNGTRDVEKSKKKKWFHL